MRTRGPNSASSDDFVDIQNLQQQSKCRQQMLHSEMVRNFRAMHVAFIELQRSARSPHLSHHLQSSGRRDNPSHDDRVIRQVVELDRDIRDRPDHTQIRYAISGDDSTNFVPRSSERACTSTLSIEA
jgi:hypothetical protein